MKGVDLINIAHDTCIPFRRKKLSLIVIKLYERSLFSQQLETFIQKILCDKLCTFISNVSSARNFTKYVIIDHILSVNKK